MNKLSDRLNKSEFKNDKEFIQAIKSDLLERIKDVPTWADASRSEWVSPSDIKKAIESYTE